MGDWACVGVAIAAARHAAGLLQEDLAEELGVRTQTISDWERNVGKPSVETLNMIEQRFKLPLGHFLRAGGFVVDGQSGAEDVILRDGRLNLEQRRMLIVALRAFLTVNGVTEEP